MSYTALYRKFRPSEFEDVKGQDHIVTTLKNQIKADRIGHAYLFCGTRGTGKTTIAKIFAKAVNCEHPVDGSPCGECEVCKAIAAGSSMNVIEIDAASNNGVDNIRQIREEVEYRPTEGKYKVYIIDEVHMLSIGAFNALLKTLEEPPSYVIFILATTEAHKIPITILSRCQRYDFRRISIDTIAGRLNELMEKEQINVEERAIRYVAKVADGSMRDALSLLDQCIAFYLGQDLTYEKVLETLGAVDTEVFSRLLRQIIDKDVVGAISSIDELVIEGRELGQFVTDFAWYMRNLLLLQSSDNMEDVLEVSAENLVLLKEEATMVDGEVLMRYIRIFSELANQMKYASQKRILLEIAVIKLCRPQMEEDYASIIDRVESLEKKLEKGVVAVAPQSARQGIAAQEPEVEKATLPKAIPEDIGQVIKNWKGILSGLTGLSRTYFNKALPSLGPEDCLLLVFEDPNAYAYIAENRSECQDSLKRAIAERIGKEVQIQVKQNESGQPSDSVYPDLRQLINFDIEEDDF
ncbi:MAG: DNA polymerase III subunit gamma/tau [Lachnospiraceae bacterium]|nr:DNA polymerase III subunit gamma/tau [Lachnospiraceae bacterium]